MFFRKLIQYIYVALPYTYSLDWISSSGGIQYDIFGRIWIFHFSTRTLLWVWFIPQTVWFPSLITHDWQWLFIYGACSLCIFTHTHTHTHTLWGYDSIWGAWSMMAQMVMSSA